MPDRYGKIMGKVEVTPEMQARILDNLSRMDLEKTAEPPARRRKTITFPKIVSLAACLVVLVAGAFVLRGYFTQPPAPPPLQTGVPVPYDNTGELCAAAGFELLLPTALPKGMEVESCTLLGDGTAEVIYSNGTETLTWRMAEGDGDISGDYEEYPVVDEVAMGGYDVTLKGDKEGYRLAVWTDGAHAFALAASEPMPQQVWAEIIASLQPRR